MVPGLVTEEETCLVRVVTAGGVAVAVTVSVADMVGVELEVQVLVKVGVEV